MFIHIENIKRKENWGAEYEKYVKDIQEQISEMHKNVNNKLDTSILNDELEYVQLNYHAEAEGCGLEDRNIRSNGTRMG